MDKPAPLAWNDSLITGVPEIDAQHQILIHTLNEAGDRLSHGASFEDYEAITHELLSYALYHFETEEALMQEYGYEHSDAHDAHRHQAEHRGFTQQVIAVREQLKAGILTPPESLMAFLNDWLLRHIMLTDKRLAGFILARRGRAPGNMPESA